jgi:hypothetical protein
MRIIISAIVLIILIIFLLLLVYSNNTTETFINQKDIDAIKNYQGKITDTYDTIDEPVSDSLIPTNPNDSIKLSDYEVIEIFKYILLRPPTIQEMQKFAYYKKDEVNEYLYNSPEYDKLIKTQNNDVNNGIEGAIAKKNLINRIMTIYSTIYKEDLPIKMMTPLRDCFIHLQLNEFLFTAMLESYNYKKFEVDVLSTYVLTKKVLLKVFNKHFNVLELKLVAQQKINDTNKQKSFFMKEVDNIKKDLLSVSSSSADVVKTVISTIKANFPNVYNELLKSTIKNGGSEATMADTTDINTLNSYLSNIEKYQNYNDGEEYDDEYSYDNEYEEPSRPPPPRDEYDEPPKRRRRKPRRNDYDEPIARFKNYQKPPPPKDNDYDNEYDNDYDNEYDRDEPIARFRNYEDEEENSYEDFKTIENLELKTKTKDKIKALDDNAELYVRVYKPMVHNNSYVLPSGYKPPICTSLGQEQITQPTFTQSKLLFQGTDLNSAYKDTQVGSIMPKFIYKEYTDVKIN